MKANNYSQHQGNDYWYIHNLKQDNNRIELDRVEVGGYYMYKEKHGMVSLVKVIKKTAEQDWIGFKLKVKRVLFSSWAVPQGTVFEIGHHTLHDYPTAWHLEPCLMLLKA